MIHSPTKPLVTNLRRLPPPGTPRFAVRHRYIRVTARHGYWEHYALDTHSGLESTGHRTQGPALDVVARLNAAWDRQPSGPEGSAA